MTPPARFPLGVVIITVLVGVWAAGLTVLLQGFGWGVDQVLLVLGWQRPWWLWLAVNLLNAVLVGTPAALLAYLPAATAVREVGRAWLAGASALGLLGLARMVPGREPELHLALVAVVAVGIGYAWRRTRPAPSAPGGVGVGFATGMVMLVPWLWLGALGGALETLLAIAAAAALGWLAASVLDQECWAGLGLAGGPVGAAAGRTGPATARVLVGGLVAGVALVLVAGGAGASGAQLPLLLLLPPLGLAAAALAPKRSRLVVGGLVAAAALGPLAFVDPEEITVLLTGRDVPFWTGVATAASLVLAVPVGLVAWLLPWWRGRGQLTPPLRRWVGVAAASAMVVVAAAVHVGLGEPGLHGDRLFVILAGQADLSGLPAGTGQTARDARAREVYRRLVTHAESSQAELRSELERLRLPYTPYYLVNAVEVAGGPGVRAWLAGRDDVDRILPSQRLRPLPAAPPPARGRPGRSPESPEWNVAMVGADRVWRDWGIDGAGIVVGTSDSGVDGSHPALAPGFRGGGDSWLDPWTGSPRPTDTHGHGTHTLGSAVGRGGIGVAPGAQWTGCVNLDRNLGNPAYYLDCLQFMLAPYPSGGDPFQDGRPSRAPHVLTNSWGCPPIEGCDRSTLRSATAALHAAGIYVVVAAGNTGPRCGSIQDPPAPYPDVLTVGAASREARVASFSSRGPVAGTDKPDLLAPGVAVVSAMPGGGYAALSGTSMAAPQVAGVVALLWSADTTLIGDLTTTTRVLRESAAPVEVADPDACGGAEALTGAGLVDAHAAVATVLDRTAAEG